jgi:hypothetical protein
MPLLHRRQIARGPYIVHHPSQPRTSTGMTTREGRGGMIAEAQTRREPQQRIAGGKSIGLFGGSQGII